MTRIQTPVSDPKSDGGEDRDEDTKMEATEPTVSPENGHAPAHPTGLHEPREDPDALGFEPLEPVEDIAPELSELFEADQENRTLRVGAGPVKGNPAADQELPQW